MTDDLLKQALLETLAKSRKDLSMFKEGHAYFLKRITDNRVPQVMFVNKIYVNPVSGAPAALGYLFYKPIQVHPGDPVWQNTPHLINLEELGDEVVFNEVLKRRV